MEGVGSRLGRASARYGPTQTVFNGPVRKWKKKWVHVSSSSSRSTASKSNGSNGNGNGNGPLLMLCKWTPLSSNSSDNNGATPEEPPKRRFRYTPVAVLEEQKKSVSEKDEDETREGGTTTQPTSQSNELDIDKVLTKEPLDSDASHWDFGMSLQGQRGSHDSVDLSKDDQLKKSAIDDLF